MPKTSHSKSETAYDLAILLPSMFKTCERHYDHSRKKKGAAINDEIHKIENRIEDAPARGVEDVIVHLLMLFPKIGEILTEKERSKAQLLLQGAIRFLADSEGIDLRDVAADDYFVYLHSVA